MSAVTRRKVLLRGSQIVGASLAAASLSRQLFAADAVLPGSYGRVSSKIVRLSLLERVPALSHAAFLDHWKSVHAHLYRGTAGLVRHALNVPDPSRSLNFGYDAVEQFWFESEAALRAAFDVRGNPLARSRAEDAARFARPGSPSSVTREIVIRELEPGGAPLIKRIGFLALARGYTRESFAEEWRDRHAPGVNKMADLAGYTVDIVDPALSFDCPWAGFASLWWKSEGSAAARPKAPPGNGDPFAPTMALVGEEILVGRNTNP
jgi:EthD domain